MLPQNLASRLDYFLEHLQGLPDEQMTGLRDILSLTNDNPELVNVCARRLTKFLENKERFDPPFLAYVCGVLGRAVVLVPDLGPIVTPVLRQRIIDPKEAEKICIGAAGALAEITQHLEDKSQAQENIDLLINVLITEHQVDRFYESSMRGDLQMKIKDQCLPKIAEQDLDLAVYMNKRLQDVVVKKEGTCLFYGESCCIVLARVARVQKPLASEITEFLEQRATDPAEKRGTKLLSLSGLRDIAVHHGGALVTRCMNNFCSWLPQEEDPYRKERLVFGIGEFGRENHALSDQAESVLRPIALDAQEDAELREHAFDAIICMRGRLDWELRPSYEAMKKAARPIKGRSVKGRDCDVT
jgi:hypothetical protein